MTVQWTPDPCTGNAGWKQETICRRPYGMKAYGVGPYGKCKIIGGSNWGETLPNSVWNEELACSPFSAQAPAPHGLWRRGHG